MVAVVGEPGVGKSRLYYEFTHSHRTADWLVLEGNSVSYGKATAWLPVIELLKKYFAIEDRDDRRRITEKVAGKLVMLDEKLRAELPPFLALLDAPVEDDALAGDAFDAGMDVALQKLAGSVREAPPESGSSDEPDASPAHDAIERAESGAPSDAPAEPIAAAVGAEVDAGRIGERVIVRNMLRSYVDYRPYECWTFGSECDGGFAQYARAPARETHRVDCDWSDAELASIPCAYSTAENMLHRAGLSAGERVLVTGASGGVGSAAVQLAKHRGAVVLAVAGGDKSEAVAELGADRVIPRGRDLKKAVIQLCSF